ncbi:MAG: hypothetical protein ACYTGP_10565 [Planctomycetota bacterium]|jgi:hypothetical protein
MRSGLPPLLSTGALASVLALVACAPPPDRGFDSSVPRDRMRAIARAVAEEDRSPETLRRLVDQLDSADPAVRMMAITALERLTGEDFDYEHDAPPAERREDVRRIAAELGPRMDAGGGADHG